MRGGQARHSAGGEAHGGGSAAQLARSRGRLGRCEAIAGAGWLGYRRRGGRRYGLICAPAGRMVLFAVQQPPQKFPLNPLPSALSDGHRIPSLVKWGKWFFAAEGYRWDEI